MKKDNLDFFERITEVTSIIELEELSFNIYNYLSKEWFSPWQACKIFLCGIKNKNLWKCLSSWNEDDKDINEDIIFLRLLLEVSWLWFSFCETDFEMDQKKTLSRWLTYLSRDLGITLERLCLSLYDIMFSGECQHTFSKLIDIENNILFFNFIQKKSSAYIKIIFLNISQEFRISNALEHQRKLKENNHLKLWNAFQKLYWIIIKIDINTERIDKYLATEYSWNKLWNIFTEERIIRWFLLVVTKWVKKADQKYDIKGEFSEYLNKMMSDKVMTITESLEIIDILKTEMGLFNRNWLEDVYFSYVDKIYIITIKWIFTIKNISSSVNSRWIRWIFLRESYEWLSSLEWIVNLYKNNDWEMLETLLGEEDTRIEWKSSLLTSIEIKKPDWAFKKENLQKIAETIISMLNSEWWSILIGHVEHEERILPDYRWNILKRWKYTLFDISTEFNKYNYSIDKFYREIEDLIAKDLQIEINEFCWFISINPIYLNINEQSNFILKIDIQKSNQVLFTRWENSSILLRKRMGRRNVFADPLKLL